MARLSGVGPRLTIANNGTASNVIDVSGAKSIAICGPATLTGTVSIQISADGLTFFKVQVGGSDAVVTVDDATIIPDLPAKYLRLLSSGAEGGARTFITMVR